MGISLKNAKVGNKKGEKRAKMNLGRHLVRCVDQRQKDTRECGFGYFLDFTVEQGPTQKGFEDTFKVFPDMARAPGGKLTRAEVKALEEGKIQIAVAGVAGYVKEACGVVNDEYFERATAVQERKTNEKALSPFAGALFEIEVRGGEGKNGPYVYYEVFPYLPESSVFGDVTKGGGKVVNDAVPAGATGQTKAPPSAPKKAAEAFPPQGWAVHPDDTDYVYNESTEECVLVTELKARLA